MSSAPAIPTIAAMARSLGMQRSQIMEHGMPGIEGTTRYGEPAPFFRAPVNLHPHIMLPSSLGFALWIAAATVLWVKIR